MSSRIPLLVISAVALVSLAACGGGSMSTKGNQTFTIGGTVTGIPSGDSIVLANGTDTVTLSADGSFTFSKQVASGGSYAVTVQTPPPNTSCAVANGSGVATANVTNVSVTCTANATNFTISVSVSGLTGAGLVLQDNNADNLSVTTNGTFPFATQIASGGAYAVSILTQPTGEACTLGNNAQGTATADVTVNVTCAAAVNSYTIGGSVSGLAVGGNLVLADNGAFDSLTVIQNGAYQFNRTIPAGSTYAVTVATQPVGQTCTVANGSGTANANVTNVNVTCAATTYTIGGTLSGLTSGTVVLADNGSFDSLSLSANGGFQFAKALTAGSTYAVTVTTQPSGQTCVVTNGTGTANANVTNVAVACSAAQSYTITVDVSGLTGGTLIVSDGIGTPLQFSASGNQAFTDTYLTGAAYNVQITQQPTGETCTLSSNAVGTIGTANVTVTATCAASGNTFTIGGTLYDLSPNSSTTGVSLQNNNTDTLSLLANGPFTFATAVASGSSYSVTVSSQPTSPSQNCTVLNGTGTATANVTNVQVVCISEWTWVAGANVVAVGGIYPGNANGNPLYPGSRYGTLSGTDASGNFWLFGGLGYDINGPTVSQTTGGGGESVMSDLWEWNGSTWSFQEGDAQEGQCFDYPTPGTAGPPSSRSNAVSWFDKNGNFWMFGGYVSFNVPGFCPNAAAFNDLWEFTGGQWVFVGGGTTQNASGVYGTKGVASSTNIPGARYWATSTVDSAGNLWLFGGYGNDSAGTLGYLNDLWKFDGTNWTWVAGSNTANQKGTYTGGGAVPGARLGANSWIDSGGNFWVFGGDAYDSAGNIGPMNDLWEFPLSGSAWTFVSGSQTNSAGPNFGTQGIPAGGNVPGSREFATTWQAPNGDVWVLGGQRLGGGLYTDLWKYSGGQWTWMTGSQSVNQLGIYTGTPSQLAPGSRQEGTPWVDTNGNLWLFGGFGMGSLPAGLSGHDGFDSLQDLWEFQP